MTSQHFETAPLECWDKGKELRREHFREIWTAGERGVPLAIGLGEMFQPLLCGLGTYADMGYGTKLPFIMRHREVGTKCFEAWESLGFSRDCCGVMRADLGTMYTDLMHRSPDGKLIRPDFCIEMSFCPNMGRTGRLVADYFDIPYFYIDVPPDDFNLETAYRYLVDQLDDCLEWMGKVTGREINDEAIVEGVRNEWQSRKLWGQVQELQKAIPAPLDSRHLQSLLVPGTMVKQKQECVEFYRMLLDEVKDRVDRGISALGIEKCRLLYEWMVPWYYLQIHRYPLKYGAVFIHGTIPAAWAVWDMAEDGTWTVADTPEERGMPMRTRRDALRAMAEIYLEKTPGVHWYRTSKGDKAENDVIGRTRDWHADGVVFHQDQGCRAAQVGQSEIRMRLQKEGIPVMAFEASQCDFRVFNEAEVLDRFDAFLESLGLTPLPGWGSPAGKAEEEP